MTEFIYKDYSCKLKFGEYVFELPLNEQTAQLVDETFRPEILKTAPKTIEDVDALYNKLLDGLDKVFGEGAADKIMSGFAHPGLLELTGVIVYITTEWHDAYMNIYGEMKQNTPAANRELRRARR